MSILLREQYMELVLCKEYFAVNTQEIYKVIKMQQIYEDYDKGSSRRGLIVIRDKTIPVISLRNLFGMPDIAYTQATRIILHKGFNHLVGFIVDQVNNTTMIDEIMPLRAEPSFIKKAAGSGLDCFIKGTAFRESKVVHILDIGHIMQRGNIV